MITGVQSVWRDGSKRSIPLRLPGACLFLLFSDPAQQTVEPCNLLSRHRLDYGAKLLHRLESHHVADRRQHRRKGQVVHRHAPALHDLKAFLVGKDLAAGILDGIVSLCDNDLLTVIVVRYFIKPVADSRRLGKIRQCVCGIVLSYAVQSDRVLGAALPADGRNRVFAVS